jgi:hypothetical protein
MPRRGAQSGWILVVAAAWCLVGAPAPLAAEGLCPIDSGQQATVMNLTISGTDLTVDVVTTPAAGLGLTVTLLGSKGPTLTSATVLRSEAGLQSVVLPGAMAGAETRDIGYWVAVSAPGGPPLMEPYPFSVLFDCPSWAPCTYYPLPGVLTSGLLVTEELWTELEADPSCDLLSLLERLRAQRPDLQPDISTLIHQLHMALKGAGPGCQSAWMTVVPATQGVWVGEYEASSPSGDEAVWEYAGGSAGATLCYTAQARVFSGMGGAVSRVRDGVSSLSSAIRCVSGSDSCGATCGGTVATTFAYQSCAIAEAHAGTPGDLAQAAVTVDTTVTVNQIQLFVSAQDAGASATYPEATVEVDVVENETPTAQFEAPMEARIEAQGTFSIAASLTEAVSADSAAIRRLARVAPPGPPGPSSPGVPFVPVSPIAPSPPRTSAYAYAELFDTFALNAVSQSSCTLQPQVFSILQTPSFDVVSRSGGIKIRRWTKPPGGG